MTKSARSRRRQILLTVAGLLAVVLLYPVESVTAPGWTVRFVDKKDRPFIGMPVRQVWKNYSAEVSSHEETFHTDRTGSVSFPERRTRSPQLVRLLKPVGNILSAGVHASFGSSSYLIPLCDALETGETSAVYTGAKPPSRIVLAFFDRSSIRAATGGTHSAECRAIEAQAKGADA